MSKKRSEKQDLEIVKKPCENMLINPEVIQILARYCLKYIEKSKKGEQP